jgi:hypothetical protein
MGWIRRKLHRHRWQPTVAFKAVDRGMGLEMVSGIVRQCAGCFLCDWETFRHGA